MALDSSLSAQLVGARRRRDSPIGRSSSLIDAAHLAKLVGQAGGGLAPALARHREPELGRPATGTGAESESETGAGTDERKHQSKPIDFSEISSLAHLRPASRLQGEPAVRASAPSHGAGSWPLIESLDHFLAGQPAGQSPTTLGSTDWRPGRPSWAHHNGRAVDAINRHFSVPAQR